jgi:hypothetical protein
VAQGTRWVGQLPQPCGLRGRSRGHRLDSGRRFKYPGQPAIGDQEDCASFFRTALRCAESGLGARERSTAELGVPAASQDPGGCKHQGSSHPAGGRAAGIGQKHTPPVAAPDDSFRRAATVGRAIATATERSFRRGSVSPGGRLSSDTRYVCSCARTRRWGVRPRCLGRGAGSVNSGVRSGAPGSAAGTALLVRSW